MSINLTGAKCDQKTISLEGGSSQFSTHVVEVLYHPKQPTNDSKVDGTVLEESRNIATIVAKMLYNPLNESMRKAEFYKEKATEANNNIVLLNETLEEDKKKYNELFEKTQTLWDKLKETKAALQQANEEKTKTEKANEQAKDDLQKLFTAAGGGSDINTALAKFGATSAELGVAENKCKELEEKNKQLEEELVETKKQLAEAKKQLEEKKQEIEKLEKERVQALDSLNKSVTEMAKALTTAGITSANELAKGASINSFEGIKGVMDTLTDGVKELATAQKNLKQRLEQRTDDFLKTEIGKKAKEEIEKEREEIEKEKQKAQKEAEETKAKAKEEAEETLQEAEEKAKEIRARAQEELQEAKEMLEKAIANDSALKKLLEKESDFQTVFLNVVAAQASAMRTSGATNTSRHQRELQSIADLIAMAAEIGVKLSSEAAKNPLREAEKRGIGFERRDAQKIIEGTLVSLTKKNDKLEKDLEAIKESENKETTSLREENERIRRKFDEFYNSCTKIDGDLSRLNDDISWVEGFCLGLNKRSRSDKNQRAQPQSVTISSQEIDKLRNYVKYLSENTNNLENQLKTTKAAIDNKPKSSFGFYSNEVHLGPSSSPSSRAVSPTPGSRSPSVSSISSTSSTITTNPQQQQPVVKKNPSSSSSSSSSSSNPKPKTNPQPPIIKLTTGNK